MSKKIKMELILLLFIFISGSFNLERLNIDSKIEIRYILFAVYFIIALVLNKNNGNTISINYSTKLLFISVYIFYFISLLSFFLSPNPLMSLSKIYEVSFMFLITINLIYLVNKCNVHDYFDFISKSFVVIGLFYNIPIIFSVLSGAERGSFSLGGANVTTRIIFFSMICAFYRFTLNRKLKYLVFSIFYFSGVIFVGSRGGIVGLLISLLVLVLLNMTKIKTPKSVTLKNVSFFLVGLSLMYIVYEPIKNIFVNRVFGLTFGGTKIYTAGRDSIYSNAIDMINENPIFGNGINSFTIKTGEPHPHNLILELWLEYGIIGIFFYCIVLFCAIFLLFRFKKTKLYLFSVFPFYMIIVHMFSGDIYDFRYFLFWGIPLLRSLDLFDKKNSILSLPKLNEQK